MPRNFSSAAALSSLLLLSNDSVGFSSAEGTASMMDRDQHQADATAIFGSNNDNNSRASLLNHRQLKVNKKQQRKKDAAEDDGEIMSMSTTDTDNTASVFGSRHFKHELRKKTKEMHKEEEKMRFSVEEEEDGDEVIDPPMTTTEDHSRMSTTKMKKKQKKKKKNRKGTKSSKGTKSVKDPTNYPTPHPTEKYDPTIHPTLSPSSSDPTHTPTDYPTLSHTMPPVASKSGKAAKAAKQETHEPTLSPTEYTTIAPTESFFPPNAAYYNSFERPNFPENYIDWEVNDWDGWEDHESGGDNNRKLTRHNKEDHTDEVWHQSTEEAANGIYSIKSPHLANEAGVARSSSVTLFHAPYWPGGTLYYSYLAYDLNLPRDTVEVYIDDVFHHDISGSNPAWEWESLYLQPGGHSISWVYRYNPWHMEADDLYPHMMSGVMFLDDVYFVPDFPMPTYYPTSLALSPSPSPPSDDIFVCGKDYFDALDNCNENVECPDGDGCPDGEICWMLPYCETPHPTMYPTLTSEPTMKPEPCQPLDPNPDSFEDGMFPSSPWSTRGDDDVWALTTGKAYDGMMSIRSPDLGFDVPSPKSTSNATLHICDDFEGGILKFQFIASVQPPFDKFVIYANGAIVGQIVDVHEWTEFEMGLAPGAQRIDFSYEYNIFDLENFPPSPGSREGGVWLDMVTVERPGPTEVPTLIPTMTPTYYETTTIAPTSIPNGAVYYRSFEDGTFPRRYPEFTTSNDGDEDLVWKLTRKDAYTGIYSLRSPALYNKDSLPGSANLTLTTNPDWDSGTLHFSFLAGIQMPLDLFEWYVDGVTRGRVFDSKEAWEEEIITLAPGEHTIDFVYEFNPLDFPELPPADAFPGRTGEVFIDEIYFIPDDAPQEPTASPVDVTPSPTNYPDGAEYYDSFERRTYPDLDPEWTTTNPDNPDLVWELTSDEANTGLYSIKSPMLYNEEGDDAIVITRLSTNPQWDAGILFFAALANVHYPLDKFAWYVDGVLRGEVTTTEFQFREHEISLSPGSHDIDFIYMFNPGSFPPENLPPPDQVPGYVGTVWLDDIYFKHFSVPTVSPTVPLLPTTTAPTIYPEGALYYRGFEQGDFPFVLEGGDPEWTTYNDGDSSLVWELTTERANSGLYSIRSPLLTTDEIGTPASARAIFITDPSWPAGRLTFHVSASVEMPLDKFEWLVDDVQRGEIFVTKNEFVETFIGLTPGQHTIEFVYHFNPLAIPSDNLPPPLIFPDRVGAVFLDDVYFETF